MIELVNPGASNRWGWKDRPSLRSPEVDPLPPVHGDRPVESTDPRYIPRGEETILVLEDQPEVLDSTCAILERLGYTVLAAADADRALEVAREAEHIDLVLADIVLPARNGITAADEVRALFPQAGVLLMSAYTSDVVLPTGEASERHAFIAKPFALATLARTVRRVLGGRS